MNIKMKYYTVTDEELVVGEVYEFAVSQCETRTGKVTLIEDNKITFDCSESYKSNIFNCGFDSLAFIRKPIAK